MSRQRTPLYANIAQNLAAPDLIRQFSINRTLTPIQKASASESVISYGRYNGPCRTVCVNREVALKVSVHYTDNIFNHLSTVNNNDIKHRLLKQRTLSFETEVYKQLTAINPRPNFNEWYNLAPYVTRLLFMDLNFAQMAAELNKLTGILDAKQALMDSVKQLCVNWIAATGVEPNTLLILVTEKESNVSTLLGFLTDTVQGYNIGAVINVDNILKNIILQGLMGIIAIHNRGITHNDMHMSNLLVDNSPNEFSAYYMHAGLKFKVNASIGRLLFFDWDNAHCANCGNNLYLNDICRVYGTCDILNMKYDIYVFLVTLKNAVSNIPAAAIPEFTNFFQQLRLHRRAYPPSIESPYEWRLSIPNGMTTDQFKTRLNTIVPDVEVLLQHDFFRELQMV